MTNIAIAAFLMGASSLSFGQEAQPVDVIAHPGGHKPHTCSRIESSNDKKQMHTRQDNHQSRSVVVAGVVWTTYT